MADGEGPGEHQSRPPAAGWGRPDIAAAWAALVALTAALPAAATVLIKTDAGGLRSGARRP